MSNYQDGILSPHMPTWIRYLANLVVGKDIKFNEPLNNNLTLINNFKKHISDHPFILLVRPTKNVYENLLNQN